MANIRSSKKDIRRTEKRTLANQGVKSRVRTLRKKVLTAIEASLSEFSSAADKAAKTKVIHANTSARYKSRLAKQISGLTQKA